MGDAGVQALSRGASPKGLGLGEGHRSGGRAMSTRGRLLSSSLTQYCTGTSHRQNHLVARSPPLSLGTIGDG